MSVWLPFIPPLFTALAIIAVLGLPISFALRLRGYAIIIVAVPAAIASIAITSIAARPLGIAWNILSPLTLSLVLALVLLALRRYIGRPRGPVARPHRLWLPTLSAAIGGLVIAFILVTAMKTPGAIGQNHDSNFHYNLLRHVLNTGSASSLAQDLSSPDSPSFYPMVWHAFSALIVQLSGASLQVTTNALLLVVSAVIWPLAAVALTRAVISPNARTTVLAGVLSAAFPSFPLFLQNQHPNLLAYAIAPFAIVAALQLLNLGRARDGDPLPPAARWLLLFGTVGASVLSHPNALHSLLVWAVLPVAWAAYALLRRVPGLTPLRASLTLVGTLAFVVIIGLAWRYGQTSYVTDGPVGYRRAVLNVLGSSYHSRPEEWQAWALSVLILIGVLAAMKRFSLNWLIGVAVLFGALYVMVMGFPMEARPNLLTSPWYHAPRRIAALICWATLPLAALGASRVVAVATIGYHRVRRSISASQTSSMRRSSAQVIAVSAVLLLAITQANLEQMRTFLSDGRYRADAKASLLSPDEFALLERLGEHVPEGDVILNNPWNGGSLAYAFSGREVIYPHTGEEPTEEEQQKFAQLKAGDPAACALLDDWQVSYVLDFGTRASDRSLKAEWYADLTKLEGSALLTEVDREGDKAVLYEVTGC